jgi:menaquinone-specific isochorismate synthase
MEKPVVLASRSKRFTMKPHMMEFAFFRLPDGRAWIGEGPFESLAQPDARAACFYINDFDLSDALPWKKPERLHEVNAEKIKTWARDEAGAMRVQWDKPATEWFKMAFRRIRREVLAGRLEKMVPVLAEHGTRLSGRPENLLHHVIAAPSNMWGYAHVSGDRGFLGATPELLFRLADSQIETMALAGTAKPGDQKDFLSDVKEIQEHELVASFLEEQLCSVGKVTRDPREVLETSGLVHFKTRLRASLKNPVSVGDLVSLLHPTPAVGCLPRQDEWLTKLREYRALLKAPGFFGAPFGFSINGEHHLVVAIRGIGWEGDKIVLPSGCGIVGGSAFDHEWRELRLKREAVLKLFGL